MAVDLIGDQHILDRTAGRDQPKLRIERHARRRVEHGQIAPLTMLLEIALVRIGIGGHVAPEHRQAFGPDNMVGCGRALLADPR